MTAPITCFTALIDIAEDAQCEELEEYLGGKGADITSSNETELLPRLQHIIDNSHVVFNQQSLDSAEIEGFFYSVVSLFHIVTPDEAHHIVQTFCDKLSTLEHEHNIPLRIRLLRLMFCHFPEKDSLRYLVLLSLVRLAGPAGLVNSLSLDFEKVGRWVELWALDTTSTRELYTLIWEAYKHSSDIRLSSRILTALLSTYTDTDAHQADPALVDKLVVLVISNPCLFVFDHILSLPPVAALRTHKVYQLLHIFVSEKLTTFMKFFSENGEFVKGLGLSEEFCVQKMRQLTLVSLAMEAGEIPFSVLAAELHLEQDKIEQFVINAVRLKLIEARINQTSKTLIIRTSIYRTFDNSQWKVLHDRLLSWQQSVSSVKTSLNSVKT